MKRFIVLFIYLLAIGNQLVAQTQISGFLEYDNITYFRNTDREKINARNQIILQPEVRHELGAKANIFGSIEFRYDQADPSRSRVYLDEAYMNLYLNNLDLRIGKQIFSWGRADGFNPTDNLSIWDFSDILDIEDEKLGQVAIDGKYYLGNWNIEGVLAPAFTESILPKPDSRWWYEFPQNIGNPYFPDIGNETIPAMYTFLPSVLPDEGIDSWQYAFRVTGRLEGWDLSLSWFDGYDDLPSFHTDMEMDSSLTAASVSIQPEYHKRRVLGGDFATSIGDLSLRGEAAYYLTEDWKGDDPAIDDPYFQYVLGIDYAVKNILSDKELWLMAEWIQEIQMPDRNTQYELFDLNHVFRRSLLGRAEFRISDFSKIKLSGIYNVYNNDWYLQPEFEWSMMDGLQFTAFIDVMGGSQESFFGSFKDNDRVQVRMKYSF